jgi:mannose-6-phosphate isomerase-like protein (cupin superfamily)
LHKGKGAIKAKFFRFGGASKPSLMLIYDIPPGASEGVHVHGLSSPEGALDEYYYIVAGSGQMNIGGAIVPVQAGDHVHTPMGTPHGIENTHASQRLKVFLTAIDRAPKASNWDRMR